MSLSSYATQAPASKEAPFVEEAARSDIAAANHQRLRSLHPNHAHQIDPSTCLVFYMGGRQHTMDEATSTRAAAAQHAGAAA